MINLSPTTQFDIRKKDLGFALWFKTMGSADYVLITEAQLDDISKLVKGLLAKDE